MFCKYCGTEIKNRDTFCANCGNPVNNTVDLKMQHRKRNNWNFIAALMFVAYALLSIMVSLIVWHSNIDMLDVLLWISYVTLVAILFINVKNLILVAGVTIPLIIKCCIEFDVYSQYKNDGWDGYNIPLYRIFELLSWTILLVLVILFVVKGLHLYRNKFKIIYFVPAVLMLCSMLLWSYMSKWMIYDGDDRLKINFFTVWISFFFQTVGMFFVGRWITE